MSSSSPTAPSRPSSTWACSATFAEACRSRRAATKEASAAVSRCAFLVRSRRPGKPDTQLRFIIAGGSHCFRAAVCGRRRIRGKGSPETRRRGRTARSPVRGAAALSDCRYSRKSSNGGPVGNDGRCRGRGRGLGNVFQPLRGSELLARSAIRRELPGAGPGSAAEDDFAGRYRQYPRGQFDRRAAAGESTGRPAHDDRAWRTRPAERTVDAGAIGEPGQAATCGAQIATSQKRWPMRASRRAALQRQIRGQVSALREIFGEFAIGLAAAIGVILLLLTANFQSIKLALVVLSTAPAVLAGSC